MARAGMTDVCRLLTQASKTMTRASMTGICRLLTQASTMMTRSVQSMKRTTDVEQTMLPANPLTLCMTSPVAWICVNPCCCGCYAMLCCGGDQLGLGKESTVRPVDVASTSGRHSRGRGDRFQSHLRTGAGGRWRSLCCSGWFVLKGQLEQFHLPTAVHPGPHLDAEPRPRTYTDGGLLGESDHVCVRIQKCSTWRPGTGLSRILSHSVLCVPPPTHTRIQSKAPCCSA